MATKTSNTINRALIEVSNLPIERFKVPGKGRKWKQLARTIQALLNWLARFANSDGTFTRTNGDGSVRDYSPGVDRQSKHFGFTREWIYKLQDYLKALGFLNWTRKNRQAGRTYTITIPDVNYSLDSDVNYSSPDVNYSSPDVNSASKSDVNSRVDTSVSSVLPPVLPTADWVGALQKLYGQSGIELPSGLSANKNSEAILARVSADGWPIVEYAWKLALGRDFNGLTKTTVANVFLKEYPEWKARAASAMAEPEIDVAAFQAQLDRWNAVEREKIMNPKPEPTLSAEDLLPPCS